MTEKKQKPFSAVCKQFFGLLPGQKLSEFAAELRQLTTKDKREFCRAFREMGIDCADPPVSK